MPGIQRILQPLTEFLHCEVDDGSRAAPRGGARAGLEIIGCRSTAKGHGHVSVRVDAPGNNVFAVGIDHSIDGFREVHPEQGAAGQ